MRKAQGRRGARSRRPYHHGNLRPALIEAGLALIARGGSRALTLREVGRRVGVSATAAYNHFADKQALLAAIAEQGFRTMADGMRLAAEGHEADPLGRLHALGRAYVHFALAHSAHFRVMFGGELGDCATHPGPQVATADAFDLLPATVADCQRVGLVFGGDPVALAARVWSAIHGLAALLVDGKLNGRGAEDLEALVQGVMASMYLGVAPRAPSPRSPRRAQGAGSGGDDYDT